MDAEFLKWIGRVVSLFCILFTLACAVAFWVDARNAMRLSSEPTFTIEPDTSHVAPPAKR